MSMRLARVFARKTSMCPTDRDCYFSTPDLSTPKYDEVHISVTFTWDIKKGKELADGWKNKGRIKFGGFASPYGINGNMAMFQSGRYLRKGVTITSRGCPNKCSYCLVQQREGNIRELPIVEGNIIQDNNILACSREHIQKVFKMLRGQKAIEFKGGLETNRLEDWHVEEFKSLRVNELWFACDTPSTKELERVVPMLKDFSRNKLRCYVLIGKDIVEEESRLREVFRLGFLPFAQLYQPEKWINYSREWKQFARRWSRPAIIKGMMK